MQKALIIILLGFCLTSCSSFIREEKDGPPNYAVNVAHIADATPQAEPHSRYGNKPAYEVHGKWYHTLRSAQGYDQVGIASWYGKKFHGRLTSSREPYHMLGMTAASRNLPLPTYVRVTNLHNGRSVVVKVNDRGPFSTTDPHRIIDLSYAAAKKLGFADTRGTARVRVVALNPHTGKVWLAASTHHPISQTNDLSDHGAPVYAVNAQSTSKHYLQLGVFSQRHSAEMLKNQLAGLVQVPVFIKPGLMNDQEIYRVQVGPMLSLSRTDHLKEQLLQEGFSQVMTVKG